MSEWKLLFFATFSQLPAVTGPLGLKDHGLKGTDLPGSTWSSHQVMSPGGNGLAIKFSRQQHFMQIQEGIRKLLKLKWDFRYS